MAECPVDQILRGLSGPRRVQALSDLLDLFGDRDLVAALDGTTVTRELCDIYVSHSNDATILSLSGQCIQSMIIAEIEGSFEAAAEHVIRSVLDTVLISTSSVSVVESGLQIYKALAEIDAGVIIDDSTLEACLLQFHRLTKLGQRDAINLIREVCCQYTFSGYFVLLPSIVTLFTHHDQQVVASAVMAFEEITKRVDLDQLKPNMMNKIAVALQVLTDRKHVQRVLRWTSRLVSDARFAEALLCSDPDFWLVYEQHNSGESSHEILWLILEIIGKLLPPMTGDSSPNSIAFAQAILPFIEHIFVHRLAPNSVTLDHLAKIYRHHSPSDAANVFKTLGNSAVIRQSVPMIFNLLTNMKNKAVLAAFDVLAILETADSQSVKQLRRQIGQSVVHVTPVVLIKDIKAMDHFSRVCSLSAARFFLSKGFPVVYRFLSRFKGDANAIMHDNLVKLVGICHDLLLVLPLPDAADSLNSRDIQDFMSHSILITTDSSSEPGPMSFPFLADLASLEISLNEARGLTINDALAAIDPPLAKILKSPEFDTTDTTKKAILHRACRTPNYLKMRFRVNDTVFTTYEAMYRVSCWVHNGLNEVFDNVFQIKCEVAEDEKDIDNFFDIKDMVGQDFKQIIVLLYLIRRIDPSIDLVSQDFASLMIPYLSSPALSIGRESFAASLIWQCPILFPLSSRLLFVQASAFDLPVSVKALNKRFVYSSQPIEFETVIRVVMDRNTLFEDGLVLLDRLGQGQARFEIEMDNGIGSGPTQEFFTLFSHELCRRRHGLWMSHDHSGEFVTPGNGLFPRPDANPSLFYILGILCAKSFTSGYRIEIPIHPCFFDVVNGEFNRKICSEVDPEFTENLLAAQGLADFKFVFPGTEYELMPKGRRISVTKSNWNLFVDKVFDAMLCKNLAAEFRRGFNRVLPWKAMLVFTGNEVSSLFKGNQPTKFTLQELQKGVRPTHGYAIDSPQIQWLFTILLELDENQIQDFLQFTTGGRLLPFGGLAALGLTVAKASDKGINALPTVMTCSRYLKLPEYPTLQVMRAKLRQAISDGRHGFDKT